MENLTIPVDIRDGVTTYNIRRPIGISLIPGIPLYVREAIDDEDRCYGVVLLPPAFEGVDRIRAMAVPNAYDFDCHFLESGHSFHDDESDFNCIVFSIEHTRLAKVKFLDGSWPEKFLKVVIKQVLICSAVGFKNFVHAMLEAEQIYLDTEAKLVKIATGPSCYRLFSTAKTDEKTFSPPEGENLDHDKAFTWRIGILGLRMAYGIESTSDIRCQSTLLQVTRFLSKEKRMFSSWSAMKTPAASAHTSNNDRFSKEFMSFLGLCFADLKKRPTPMQALDHPFLKDTISEDEMITCLIDDGHIDT